MKQITSVAEFKEAKAAWDGYIVITDDTGNTVHRPRCANVDISNFREKVLANKGRHGAYYFVEDLVEAMEAFTPRPKKCDNCRPK
ncbi:hypothetical protein GCM10025857_26980 [Alicyclobacillus contaminans]|nr:hypothetical protein GCM10025857_26980 [Alicyclobacillus contaminans]